MAQWMYQFSGHTHASRVSDRRVILSNAISDWNAATAEHRDPQRRKKLIRLADDLLSAMLKEKQASLDRAGLDERSEKYLSKMKDIQSLREGGVDGILHSMRAAGW